VFLTSALPTISTLAQQRAFGTLQSAYVKTVARMLLGLGPVLGVVWFLAPWLLQRLAPDWVQAVWPLRLLSFATVFMLLNSLSSVFIVALGALRVVTLIALLNLVVFFTLAYRWVPTYGASGAAMATTVMEGVNCAMQTTLVVWLMRRAAREEGAR
jgi:O-antigen/teichoic acid export membrane protein